MQPMQPQGRSGKKTFPKKFKGDCRICGKKGYKASDCWENPNKERSQYSIISQHPQIT
jgi:hypothetical protein